MGRVLQGISVSPIECLPSATITEVYFLHERAYRIGIYSLLLLGGKNLVPLVSAAIIESYDWRWVFWSVELNNMTNDWKSNREKDRGPESFWERTPLSSLVSEGNLNNPICSDSRENYSESRRAASQTDQSMDIDNVGPAHPGN
ncbi:hypothetical protein GcC1_130019, partial [Golovinomyces cichoracearum]